MSSCRWSACMRCPIRWHPMQSFFAIHYGRGLGTQSLGMATAQHKLRTLWRKGTSLTFWQTFIVTWVASCILLLAIFFIWEGHVFAPLLYASQRWESAHIDDAGEISMQLASASRGPEIHSYVVLLTAKPGRQFTWIGHFRATWLCKRRIMPFLFSMSDIEIMRKAN